LLDLPLDGVVQATGPGGTLFWRGEARALLIATGTGLSPLRAIIHEQIASGSSEPMVLLFGCRDAAEELWGDELRMLASLQPRLRFLPTHSQPAPGYTGLVGRVQLYLPELVQKLGGELRAYLCGHTPMVNDCTALLLEAGVAADRIHGESY
jgi:NAD(P)H-flavin reductase